jgi:hypothetical protein
MSSDLCIIGEWEDYEDGNKTVMANKKRRSRLSIRCRHWRLFGKKRKPLVV